MKIHEKTFAPRLPEAAQKRLKSGGAHKSKKYHNRANGKREFERQLKDFRVSCLPFKKFNGN